MKNVARTAMDDLIKWQEERENIYIKKVHIIVGLAFFLEKLSNE